MKQRELTDSEGTRWVCVQAFAGVTGAVAEEAAERVVSDAGTVPVIATPDGGAQSVRMELKDGWYDSASDDELLSAIKAKA